ERPARKGLLASRRRQEGALLLDRLPDQRATGGRRLRHRREPAPGNGPSGCDRVRRQQPAPGRRSVAETLQDREVVVLRRRRCNAEVPALPPAALAAGWPPGVSALRQTARSAERRHRRSLE